MLRQSRFDVANRPFGVIIITEGGFIGYWTRRQRGGWNEALDDGGGALRTNCCEGGNRDLRGARGGGYNKWKRKNRGQIETDWDRGRRGGEMRGRGAGNEGIGVVGVGGVNLNERAYGVAGEGEVALRATFWKRRIVRPTGPRSKQGRFSRIVHISGDRYTI